MNQRLLLQIGVLQYVMSSAAYALDSQSVQIHGFASQAYLLSDGNKLLRGQSARHLRL